MKRLHVHVAVEDLDASIRFYSQLFDAQPAVTLVPLCPNTRQSVSHDAPPVQRSFPLHR